MRKKGIFTISIDVELAWGTFDHGGAQAYVSAYKQYRFIIDRLLALFKRYDFGATWAVVGHLFLDKCSAENGVLHADIVRPNHRWFKRDWFALDPGTDIMRDELWYGKDIVGMIQNAVPVQEIASHSFSHPVFSDRGCTRGAAETDVRKCRILAQESGLKLETFVFPRNEPAYLDVLKDNGFIAYRGKADAYSRLKSKRLRKVVLLFQDFLAAAPAVVEPRIREGLVEIPASMIFRFAHGKSRLIPDGARLSRAKKGLSRVAKEKKIFHLWFHPISFAYKSDLMFDEFERILAYAAFLREKGALEFMTMRAVARDCLSGNATEAFNAQAVDLHEERSPLFQHEYARYKTDYADAFRYGRKKIEEHYLDFLHGLKQNSVMLDAGSGPGYFLSLASKHGFRAIGIDLSVNMLSACRRDYPSIRVNRADIGALPFKDGAFDAVVSIETLRYFSDRQRMLKEIWRVTAKGGKVFITAAPMYSLNFYGLVNTFCRVFRIQKAVSCYQSFETVSSLKRQLEEAGFKEIEIFGFFFGPFFMLDKMFPALSGRLIQATKGIDERLARLSWMRNFSNHLLAVAKKG